MKQTYPSDDLPIKHEAGEKFVFFKNYIVHKDEERMSG